MSDWLLSMKSLRNSGMAPFLIAAVLWAVAPVGARATEPSWASVGPFGVEVSVLQLVVDPNFPTTVYAGFADASIMAGGVSRSTDLGNTWVRASSGLSGQPVWNLAIDPRDSSTLYACDEGDLVRSETSGASWRRVGGLPAFSCGTVAVAPGTPSTVFVGTPAGVFKSTDRGLTFTAATDGLPSKPLRFLAVDPVKPSTLYAAFDDGVTGTGSGGIYKTVDAGGTWFALTNGIGTPQVQRVAVAPSDSRTVYAATSLGLFRSADGGASWAGPSGGAYGFDLAVDFRSPQTAYAVTDSGLSKTTDGGTTWIKAPLPSSYSVALDPSSPGRVYCGAHRFGVFRSDDGGATWGRVNEGPAAVRITALAANASGLYAGIWLAGVYKTSDRGATWISASNGLGRGPVGSTLINVLLLSPDSSRTVFAATDEGIFRSLDGAATWQLADPGVLVSSGPTRDTALAIDPITPATLYCGLTSCFFAGCEGAIFKTTDGGGNWARLDHDFFFPVTALAVDPSAPSTVYAGAASPPGLYRSTNGGASWDRIQGFPSSPPALIAVAPGSPSVAYAVGGRLYRSMDGGSTWMPSSPPTPPDAAVTALVIDPRSPRVLYVGIAGAKGGVYRSADAGDTWALLDTGLAELSVTALALDPTHPATLFASTRGSGVFALRLENGDGGPCFSSASILCLGSRFRAEMSWRTPDGGSGTGRAFPLTADTGAFWFFSPNNIEVAVKVLDGRAVNGKFWVFGGQLTDVEYTLTVTDTKTGAVWTRHNAPGQLASFADTAAF